MTPIEDRVRTAIHATAKEVPPGPPPPLTLPQRRTRRSRRPVWRGWALIPLAVVCLAVAVAVAALSLIPSPRSGFQPKNAATPAHQPTRSQTSVAGVPTYYVALTSVNGRVPDVDPGPETATIRATATGKVVATVALPHPYIAFTGVTAAADDRTFVLVALGHRHDDPGTDPANVLPPARFYVLHFDPASRTAVGRVRLQALPAAYVPPGSKVQSMALSPDGSLLAASIGPSTRSTLYVYNLVTGKQRAWSWSGCVRCPGTQLGGGYVNLYPGVLSWAADRKTLALVFQYSQQGSEGEVRLLDTGMPGKTILSDSRLAATWPSSDEPVWGSDPYFHEVMITPDGRTLLAVRQVGPENDPAQQLITISTATGKITAGLNQPWMIGTKYEQVYWTSSSGRALLISGAQKGGGAGVLKDGRYTPIPWSSEIFAAAW
jgi:hypothetical protein